MEFDDEGALPTVWTWYSSEGKLIPPLLLCSLLQTLPHLKTLRLRDMFLQSVDIGPAPEPLESSFISLNQLSISYPFAHTDNRFPSLSPILKLRIKTKELQIAMRKSRNFPVATKPSHFSQLDTLVLSAVPCASGLPQHFMGLNVRNLTLLSAEFVQLPSYNEYFREMGHTLRRLCVQIKGGGRSGAYILAKLVSIHQV